MKELEDNSTKAIMIFFISVKPSNILQKIIQCQHYAAARGWVPELHYHVK